MGLNYRIKLIFFFACLTSLATSQDICNITWTKRNESNFRNAFKATVQPSVQSCLDECKAFSGCLAVDVDMRNSSNQFYICWFHSNPKDILNNYNFTGVDSYVKHVNCSKSNRPTALNGLPGSIGATGVIGPIGFPGVQGLQGYLGLTGDTGSIGVPGISGFPGIRGVSGANGVQGLVGQRGVTGIEGPQGIPGSIGFPGPSASFNSTSNTFVNGRVSNAYVQGSCQPSWTVNHNLTSPGGMASPVVASIVDRCQEFCLSVPNCVAVDVSVSVCNFHNSTADLLVQTITNGTDQYVLSSRCSPVVVSSSPGVQGIQGATGAPGLGLRGSDGATGIPGLQGSKGRTGNTGFRGRTGIAGIIGFKGRQGLQGVQGNTGVSGFTGVAGPPGLDGSLKIKSLNEKIFNVKDSCQNVWLTLDGYYSPGVAEETTADNSRTCYDSCLVDAICVGADFSVKNSSCRFHRNVNNLVTKVRNPDTDQMVVLSRCPTNLDFPSTVKPIYAPIKFDEIHYETENRNSINNYGDDNEEDNDDKDNDDNDDDDGDDTNCLSLDEDDDILSKPEFYALIVTPPLTILINVLCLILYFGGRKVVRKFTNDDNGEVETERFANDDDDDDGNDDGDDGDDGGEYIRYDNNVRY